MAVPKSLLRRATGIKQKPAHGRTTTILSVAPALEEQAAFDHMVDVRMDTAAAAGDTDANVTMLNRRFRRKQAKLVRQMKPGEEYVHDGSKWWRPGAGIVAGPKKITPKE